MGERHHERTRHSGARHERTFEQSSTDMAALFSPRHICAGNPITAHRACEPIICQHTVLANRAITLPLANESMHDLPSSAASYQPSLSLSIYISSSSSPNPLGTKPSFDLLFPLWYIISGTPFPRGFSPVAPTPSVSSAFAFPSYRTRISVDVTIPDFTYL